MDEGTAMTFMCDEIILTFPYEGIIRAFCSKDSDVSEKAGDMTSLDGKTVMTYLGIESQ